MKRITALLIAAGCMFTAASAVAATTDDVKWVMPLPAFKAPKRIVLSTSLPKTERGKLDRKALTERWRQQVGG